MGQISIGGYRYSVGISYAQQDVRVTFDADTVEFVAEDSQQVEIRRLGPKGLTVEEITGLEATPKHGSSGLGVYDCEGAGGLSL